MILTITLITIAIVGVSYFFIMKKKKPVPEVKQSLRVKTEPTSSILILDNTNHPNVSFGYAALSKSNEVEPALVPIHKSVEVENNLGAETAVITPETKVPKKRAPRKKKEEKV